MPIAMLIGTSIAIEFYKNSATVLLILSALIGLMACVYLMVSRSDRNKMIYNNIII